LAGYVDAVGFLKLGGVFIAFMSGNSTELGAGLGTGRGVELIRCGLVILTFLAGVVAGALAARLDRGRDRQTVLAVESALLLIASLLQMYGHEMTAISVMTLAMGVENGVFQRHGEVSTALTYMTGTLVKMGQEMASALTGGPRFGWATHFLHWAAFVAGAVAGGAGYHRFGMQAIWAAAIWAACATLAAGWQPTNETRSAGGPPAAAP